jgi:hypothetical protein
MSRLRVTFTLPVLLATMLILTPSSATIANEKSERSAASVDLRILPLTLFEGHSVQTRIIVEPASANRLLVVRIDSEAYYSSTERQLDGEAGPRSHFVNWHELPAGEYRVEAVVKDSRGQRAQTIGNFTVLGRTAP